MKFEEAMAAMREGKKVKRGIWPEGHIEMWTDSKGKQSITRYHQSAARMFAWFPYNEDLVASDWQVI